MEEGSGKKTGVIALFFLNFCMDLHLGQRENKNKALNNNIEYEIEKFLLWWFIYFIFIFKLLLWIFFCRLPAFEDCSKWFFDFITTNGHQMSFFFLDFYNNKRFFWVLRTNSFMDINNKIFLYIIVTKYFYILL